MSKTAAFDAIAEWDGEAMSVLDRTGRRSGTDLGALRGKQTVVVLSHRAAQVRATELPPASPDDLRQLVRIKLGDLFPAGPGELAFSVAPRVEDGTPGPTPIYAARVADLTEIHGAARAGGFRVAAILPVAAGAAMLAQEMGLTDALIVAPDGPSLGLDIVRAGGTTLSRPAAIGSPIESEVRRTFLAAGGNGAASVPVVAAGGASVAFADRSTERTPIAALLEAPERWEGLDIVPEDVRARRAADVRRARMRQGGMILAASVLVLAYVINGRSTRGAEVDRLQRRYNAEVKRYENVLNLTASENLKRDPQIKILERAFTPAQRTSDVTFLVTSLLPKGAWITALTQDKGKPIQIRGTALDSAGVSTFLRNLGTQNRFRDVKLSFANVGEIETKPVVNFAITAFPVGNVPLEEPKAARRSAAPPAGSTPAGAAPPGTTPTS